MNLIRIPWTLSSPSTPPSSASWADRSTPCGSCASAPARVRPRGRRLPRGGCRGDPRARRARVGVGGGPRLRAAPAARARRRGARPRARGDGQLRRPDLPVPRRPLGRCRRARRPRRPARCGIDAAGVTAIRRAALVHDLGPRRHPRADLAEARAADGRRVGAGAAAPVPHRARALALAVPLRAGAGRGGAPRAARRLRLSPRRDRRPELDAAGAPARRRRRLPRDDRAAAAPRPRCRRSGRRRSSPRRRAPDGSTPTRSPRCSRPPDSAPRASSVRRG